MRHFLLIFLVVIFSGCATAPLQLQPVHGVAIESLQGSVNISLSSSAGQMSGNGVIFYKRPDSFRLSILAPFGQIILDIIVEGEKVLCIKESRKTAWKGTVADLPASLGTRIWPLMSWVVEPPHPAGPSLERAFVRPDGSSEKIFYDTAGFMQRKVNARGDEVFYSDYRTVDNIAIANRIEINAAEGSRLVLAFDDPELNRPIESAILKPKLDGYEILPLAELRGF
ncbi:MAG: outer membrane lipoprotein LolB [Geobacteraceae bacterium]|nr:outer membrane lipoprotein LolB [Geobacteraceae bacterium]